MLRPSSARHAPLHTYIEAIGKQAEARELSQVCCFQLKAIPVLMLDPRFA
jgi:hypothetical protein